jgi:transglutaminase-like putative cysteine protease
MTDFREAVAPRHLPLLAVALAMAGAPHAPRLPWWALALAATVLAWRVYLGWARLAPPPRALVLAVAGAASLGLYFEYRTLLGRDAGVALLLVMLALKLLETRTLRDAMLLMLLGYFLVVTNFLYSQSIPTALYMLLCVWAITASMMSLHYFREEPPLPARMRAAGALLVQSVPLMLVLFLFFPRVSGPLWGMPQDARAGTTGLSDTMSPGSFSDLILSDAVAFRVRFEGPIPPAKQLYWRGPVLWDFDGRTWSASRFLYGTPEYTARGEPLAYEITLEPHNRRWLFALDLPARVPPRAMSSSDLQLRSALPVTGRIRYDMVSYLDYRYGIEERPAALRRALQLPEGYNPRTHALAQRLRERFRDERALIAEVLAMFRREPFVYTLSPPPLGEHSVDEFLFETRSGFCEHYASAFAVLMRAAGIPARVVTGYQGGEVNTVGDYLIVRQAEAHAWTEVWLRDEGWVRVDPTAAVSPLRVESGIAAAVPRTDPLPLFVRGDLEWLRRMRFTWDLIANTWNQWVLAYNPERQRRLLTRVGVDDATWQTLTVVLLAATALVVAVLGVLLLRELKARVRDPVRLAYARFCEKLRRKGLPRDPAEGPLDYARRIAAARPELAAQAAAITALYTALRYGAGAEERAVRRLEQQVARFRP